MNRAAVLVLCLFSCKSPSAAAPAASEPAAKDGAAKWKRVVDAPDRSEADRKLDPGRRPAELLDFLDLRPGMRVAEVGAGGGYTSELIARAVAPDGIVYLQNDPRWTFVKDAVDKRLARPAMKNAVRVDQPFDDPLPGLKDLDEVVINVIYHDVANMPVDRVRMNRLIFNALKPGGAFVLIDSSAKEGAGLSATRSLHRIDEQLVRKEVEEAGFKLAAASDFLRNKDDARDWNSSPGAAEKAGRRGQSDRFALKFLRPQGSSAQIVPPHLRLPPGARPTRVSAELTIDETRDDFAGQEQIELQLDAATPLLWLNADGLQVLETRPAAKIIDAPPDFVGLQFAQPLPAGASSLTVRWRGKLSRTDTDGAFRQEENGAWYAMTHLEPLGARRVWPSFDEPSFKVPWKMSLRVRKSDNAFFNTPIESQEEAGAERVVHFLETKPLPSYLLAWAVGPYERVDAGRMQSGQPVGIVVTKGKSSWAKYSAQSSPKLMNVLEDYFQIPYHYPKLDLFEVPLGTGAMENPGLISFNQRINLAKPGEESPQFRMRAAEVEAHEFAHLWFGDMVTTAFWDDIWLNEAFATWMATKAISVYAPSWGAEADAVNSMNGAMANDRLLSARRIRQPIESEGDIKTAFDSITYRKGAAVIAMFEQYVGVEAFRKGVRRYLEEHADSNATAKDFLAAISADAGKDVAPAFSTFLDQPGLPLLEAKVSCAGEKGTLQLSQSRYLPLGTPPQEREQLWQIPVCARTDQGRFCTLLATKTGSLYLGACPQWTVANANAAGYYRTALDEDATARLTRNLAKLSVPEKMEFFFDAVAAARAGALDLGRALDLVAPLASDRDRHVVEMLPPFVTFLREEQFFDEPLAPKYAAFVRETVGRRLRSQGLAEKKGGEPDDARILRPLLLRVVGDAGEDEQVRIKAQELALRWLSDHKSLSPEMASAALFVSAIDGDALLYDRFHSAARAEKDRVERQRILAAMGAFRDPELVQQGLSIYLSDEFDPRESVALMWGAGDDPHTRQAALEFVEKNFDEIVKRMPRDFGALLPNIALGFCDDAHAAAVDEFFRPRARNFAGGERRFAQVLEQIKQCSAFRVKAAPAVAAFLQKR